MSNGAPLLPTPKSVSSTALAQPAQATPSTFGGSGTSKMKVMSATAEPLPGNLTGGADGCVGCVPGHTYILPGSNSTCPQGNCAYTYNPGSPGSSNYCGSSGACWTPTTVANTTPNTPAAPGGSLPAPGTTNAWVVGRSVEHGQDITLSDPISPPLGTPPSAWPKPPTAVVQTPPAPQT